MLHRGNLSWFNPSIRTRVTAAQSLYLGFLFNRRWKIRGIRSSTPPAGIRNVATGQHGGDQVMVPSSLRLSLDESDVVLECGGWRAVTIWRC